MQENNSFIRIDTIVIDLILPKCNIVFGNSFSSIYLQLLLNTNNNCKDSKWKRNKCWMGIKTIAKNVNSNERKVMKLLKLMEEVNLIKKEYNNNLYMFSINKNIYSDINLFNKNFDMKLLNFVEESNRNNIKNKFLKINKLFQKNEQWYYNNLPELKHWLLLFEQIKPGSSLMFLMIFSQNFINNNLTLADFSESKIAKRLGTSQSTINRTLHLFEKSNYFNVEYDKRKKINIIHLNEELVIMNKEEIKETINNIKTTEDLFKCPVCNKEVNNVKKLNAHIKRCKDELHTMLYSLQNTHDAFTMEKLLETYTINKNLFDEIIAKKEKENQEKEKAKKQINSVAIELVKYYYSLTNTKCPNWGKEINLIKSHLKNGLTNDEVMEIMRYMARRSYQDLRFFSGSINDALTIRQCKLDVKVPGTNAYFVKLYFSKMGQSLNDRLMLQGISKLNELRHNDYTTEQIETIVNYMIEKRCSNFNFIINIANEALQNSKSKDEMAKAYTTNELVSIALDGVFEYGIIMMKDNDYNMANKDIILRLKNDLCAGKVDLTKVNRIYNKFAVELAREIYRRNLYDNKFTAQQWMSSINLNVVNIDF